MANHNNPNINLNNHADLLNQNKKQQKNSIPVVEEMQDFSFKEPYSEQDSKHTTVNKASAATHSINKAIRNAAEQSERLNKDQDAIEKVKKASNDLHDGQNDGQLDWFDTANSKPNSTGLRSYDGNSKTDQQKLLIASENPSTTYGKKTKKFRLIPSSFFGKMTALIMVSVGFAAFFGIMNGNELNKQYSSDSDINTSVTSFVNTEKGNKEIIEKISLTKVAPNSFDVVQTKNMTDESFRRIISYMDNIASHSVGEARFNYHLINFGIKNGSFNENIGNKLLVESKQVHQNFLNNIQNDKDSLIIFIKKAKLGKDVFYKNNDIQFLANQALGLKSASGITKNTEFEKFLFWQANSVGVKNYQDQNTIDFRVKLNHALGELLPKAQTDSYVQMATGNKTDYSNLQINLPSKNKSDLKDKNDRVENLASKAFSIVEKFSEKQEINNLNQKPINIKP